MHLSAETTAWFHLVLVLILGGKPCLTGLTRVKAAETTKKWAASYHKLISFHKTYFQRVTCVLIAGRQNVVYSAFVSAQADVACWCNRG